MNAQLTTQMTIPCMDLSAIMRARVLEDALAARPQEHIPTRHNLHAGLYARTAFVPAGVVIVGALVKIPTLLIVQGEAQMFIGGESCRLSGYNVIQADAERKQAFLAIEDTHITMLFASSAKTVDEAEREFTDEFENLLSRRQA